MIRAVLKVNNDADFPRRALVWNTMLKRKFRDVQQSNWNIAAMKSQFLTSNKSILASSIGLVVVQNFPNHKNT